MTTTLNLNLFIKLPYDMKYTVRQFIDYDTKIDLLMYNHPDIMTNKYLYSIMTLDHIKNAHRNGLWAKLFAENDTSGLVYNCNGIKRFITHAAASVFPNPTRTQYTNINGDICVQEYVHPVLSDLVKWIEKCPAVQRSSRSACLISGYKAIRYLRADDIKDANYFMQGLAYKFISSIIIYCNTIQKARIERINYSRAMSRISSSLREKKAIEQRIDESKQLILSAQDSKLPESMTTLARMSTRLMKDNIYMKYIQEGMTMKEAKERLVCDRKEEKYKKTLMHNYIKAVRQATTQRMRKLTELDKKKRLADKKKKKEEDVIKRNRTVVRKKVVAYMKIAKEAASLAKKKLYKK